MYYPIQIPYLLSNDFCENMKYTESSGELYKGFVICFWEMTPMHERPASLNNIIVTDGCIDLVVSYNEGIIGFSGMSRTEFDFNIDLPSKYFGARMTPGAFQQLTGRPASESMDIFLPIDDVFTDFDTDYFFSLSFEESKEYFLAFLKNIVKTQKPNQFTSLFDYLVDNTPSTTKELYDVLHLSPRQCQRDFKKHYGLTPKMVLSIIRFQKCLSLLLDEKSTSPDILDEVNYYDQPHMINDFKRNIGITPQELINKYKG